MGLNSLPQYSALSLGLQIAQSRSYLCGLRPNRVIVNILGTQTPREDGPPFETPLGAAVTKKDPEKQKGGSQNRTPSSGLQYSCGVDKMLEP